MAHIVAVILGEDRKTLDQEVDAEFFENFEGELDITSLEIDGVEFGSVLSSPKAIQQYIDQIEESSALPYPVEVYLACIKRYHATNPDFDDVRQQVDNYFVESADKAPFVDPEKDFAIERANDFLEAFNTPHVSKEQFNTLLNHFDYDAYQQTIFTNDYDAVELDGTVYFFTKN